ncbi:hypothetical protein PIB30_021556 [Stylosanthes scabra]|uniref:Uncharacterized protein n=1 Tax=Stylosanthes scabra TaxID=79078 RepID=A0ABU6S970_9FABA|nr:hypothetical protein [Stylosanthes scabra]
MDYISGGQDVSLTEQGEWPSKKWWQPNQRKNLTAWRESVGFEDLLDVEGGDREEGVMEGLLNKLDGVFAEWKADMWRRNLTRRLGSGPAYEMRYGYTRVSRYANADLVEGISDLSWSTPLFLTLAPEPRTVVVLSLQEATPRARGISDIRLIYAREEPSISLQPSRTEEEEKDAINSAGNL